MRLSIVAAAAALLVSAAPARAEVKIGYVNLQRALNEVDEGRAAKARLKSEFEQKQKQLDDKQTEFQKLRTEFEKQVGVLSEDARKQREEDLNRRFVELQTTFQQLQKELTEREREATRGIFDRMGTIIREIAEAEGYTMILEQADAVLWAQPSLDLTNELIRKYNARHKGGAAPAAKPEAKAPAPAKPAAKPAEKKASK
jgi:outer membrane protein